MRAPPESRSLPQAPRPRWSNSESNRESTHPRASAHPALCAFSLGPAVDPRLLQPCSGSASESVQGSAQCRASPIRHGARCLESSVDSQPSSPAGPPFPGRRHAAGRSRVPPAHPLPRVSASLGALASRPLPRALPLPTAASARRTFGNHTSLARPFLGGKIGNRRHFLQAVAFTQHQTVSPPNTCSISGSATVPLQPIQHSASQGPHHRYIQRYQRPSRAPTA
jgi:hypothetical protein